MEDNKLSKILEWPYPKNLKQLYQFLGFINFYRKFIKGFLDIAAPLKGLTKSDVNVAKELISAEYRRSFETLKACFKSALY
jgi:hypothetical protein